MKSTSILVLMIALFSTTVFAEGNLGNGGRSTVGDVSTNTIKGPVTEDGDPPPPPPCLPSSTDPCDGNLGNGGRSASSEGILLFVQKYLIAIFG